MKFGLTVVCANAETEKKLDDLGKSLGIETTRLGLCGGWTWGVIYWLRGSEDCCYGGVVFESVGKGVDWLRGRIRAIS